MTTADTVSQTLSMNGADCMNVCVLSARHFGQSSALPSICGTTT